MSSETIFTIASAIECEMTEIDCARSVLRAAIEPLDIVYSPETWEGQMLVERKGYTINLLHVIDGLLLGIYHKLQEAMEALYSAGKDSVDSNNQPVVKAAQNE